MAKRNSPEPLFEMIEKLIGPEAKQVFETLYENGGELSELEIAEKTDMRMNVVRRALNLLAEKSFVTYRRVRLEDEKNRTIFLWRINYEGIPSIVRTRKKIVLDKLKAVLESQESSDFYQCPNDGIRYNFETAIEYDFTCPRCGAVLEPDEDKELRIEVLKDYIRRIEKELEGDSKPS